MSIEGAKAFLERIKTDEDFRKSVGEIATEEERMEYVKGAGFDFTKDEMANIKDELTEDELLRVSGGRWSFDCQDTINLCDNVNHSSASNIGKVCERGRDGPRSRPGSLTPCAD